MQPMFTLLAETPDYLVLEKPAGLLSVPGRQEQDCLASRVQAVYPEALVVHRLDCATSGLLLLARGAAAQRELSRLFHDRLVSKRYIALAAGCVAGEQGEIDRPMIADWPNRPRQKIDWEQGKPARTLWQVLARGADWTRLALTPITGRSHQLRLHLADMGHPLLGDALYADAATAARMPRLCLHAETLAFDWPAAGGPQHYYSPAPF